MSSYGPSKRYNACGGLPPMTCETCGRPFDARRRDHRYCSALCRSRDFARLRQQQEARRQQRDEELRVLALAARQAIEALARRLEDSQ